MLDKNSPSLVDNDKPSALTQTMIFSADRWKDLPGASLCHREPFLAECEGMLRLLSNFDEMGGRITLKDVRPLDGMLEFYRKGTCFCDGEIVPAFPFPDGTFGLSSEITTMVVRTLIGKVANRTRCVTLKDFRLKMGEVLELCFDHPSQRTGLLRLKWIADFLGRWCQRQRELLVKSAFIDCFKTRCQAVFDQYRTYCAALVRLSCCKAIGRPKSPTVNEMEYFLRSVESAFDFGVPASEAYSFRNQVADLSDEYRHCNVSVNIPHTVEERLIHCVQSFVVAQEERRHHLQSLRQTESFTKFEQVRNNLVTQHGFCAYCAGELLLEFLHMK